MKELSNGWPSTVPRTLTRPRVPKNSAEPGICTYVQPPGAPLSSRVAVTSVSSAPVPAMAGPRSVASQHADRAQRANLSPGEDGLDAGQSEQPVHDRRRGAQH